MKYKQYTSVQQCAPAINDKLLIATPTRSIGKIAPLYHVWQDCIYRTFHTESDYQLCLQQAGDRIDYYEFAQRDHCDVALKVVRAKTIYDCSELYLGDYGFYTKQGYQSCLKKFNLGDF